MQVLLFIISQKECPYLNWSEKLDPLRVYCALHLCKKNFIFDVFIKSNPHMKCNFICYYIFLFFHDDILSKKFTIFFFLIFKVIYMYIHSSILHIEAIFIIEKKFKFISVRTLSFVLLYFLVFLKHLFIQLIEKSSIKFNL